MTDKDGITSDVRSREEEYFRRKDRELVEKLRQAAAAEGARREMEHTTGIHDPAMLQELEELGFTPETVSLLPIIPVVQVAWAEGGVSDAERHLIVAFARERGIGPGSAADQLLEIWLAQRPSDDVFARAGRLIRAMLDHPEDHGETLTIEDLVHRCEAIAAASGGILGFGKISAEEKAMLSRIQSALGGR